MACKRPILMAIDGVSRELVETAGAGTYVEPENAGEYNRVIRHYLQHPELLEQQGESGYQFAHERFDRQVLAKEYLAHLTKLIVPAKG